MFRISITINSVSAVKGRDLNEIEKFQRFSGWVLSVIFYKLGIDNRPVKKRAESVMTPLFRPGMIFLSVPGQGQSG